MEYDSRRSVIVRSSMPTISTPPYSPGAGEQRPILPSRKKLNFFTKKYTIDPIPIQFFFKI